MKFVAIEHVVGEVLARHDMAEFDPYQFTPALIDDLVVSCIQADDDAPGAQSDAFENGIRADRTSFLGRLFGRR